MIKIICVGKIKEQYLNDMMNDYLKRIKKYIKIEMIELKDSNLNEESKLITRKMNLKDYNILLDREGPVVSSLKFANKINSTFIINSNITFIIGGSLGVGEDIKKKANEIISFGSITFTHGMFRGILLEQIYRAFKIINNETYHK